MRRTVTLTAERINVLGLAVGTVRPQGQALVLSVDVQRAQLLMPQ